MAGFDPRITPIRPDLAASHLRGTIDAPRFADGVAQEVIAGQAPVRNAPGHHATMVTEALRGDRVSVYEIDDEGWAWGQLACDGYVGWLPASALLAPAATPTHRVAVLRTFVFPEPSIKAPPVEALPLGATIAVLRVDGTFAVTAGGYIPANHVAPVAQTETDFVAVAERFLGTPYLWGGKSSLGLDCSGLVQVALTACGVACPRDSDMQEAALGSPSSLDALRRGDLAFWKGHVAIVRDAATLIHANAFHMAVAIEPVAEAVSRIEASGSKVTSVRRLG
jgi:cell wall-associated NlpC family hydrolase